MINVVSIYLIEWSGIKIKLKSVFDSIDYWYRIHHILLSKLSKMNDRNSLMSISLLTHLSGCRVSFLVSQFGWPRSWVRAPFRKALREDFLLVELGQDGRFEGMLVNSFDLSTSMWLLGSGTARMLTNHVSLCNRLGASLKIQLP